MKVPAHILAMLHALVYAHGADLFTSLSHLRHLLQTETYILSAIRSHLEAEDVRLHNLQRIQRDFARRRPTAPEMHQSVSRLLVLKRYARPMYQELSSSTEDHRYSVHFLTITTQELTWPTTEDLYGAAEGLCRLVEAYNVPLRNMTLLRSRSLPEPTPSDYIDVASQCLQDNYHEAAANWARLAVAERTRRQWKAATEILSRAMLSLGNVAEALGVVAKNLALPPESPYVMVLKRKYRKHSTALTQKRGSNAGEKNDASKYRSLCVPEGDIRSPPEISKVLRCRMATGGGNPVLLLQPFKMEVIYPDPKVILFHDFLSKEECEAIRGLAEPWLARAYVVGNSTNEYVKYRISESAFLADDHSTVLLSITRRISAVTGLSTESAEPYQVVNYGVGGHYTPHYDFFYAKTLKFRREYPNGQRLATFLIYLSDVIAGGATAFTSLRISVKPRMGMGLFWMNLIRPKNASDADELNFNEARQGDNWTRHGGCPVLHGSKWIVTKWIHERGQGVVNYDLY